MEGEIVSISANKAKTKWNSENYTQIKFSVSPQIAAQFKTACASANVSMASVLTRFIIDYTQSAYQAKPAVTDYWSTKRKRRKAIEEIVITMEQLHDAQECARDNIPENFRDSEIYESAEESLEKMEEALEILRGIY